MAARGHVRWEFRQHESFPFGPLDPWARGPRTIDPRAQDADRRASRFQGAEVSAGVDAAGESADDDDAAGGEFTGEAQGLAFAVGGGRTGADEGDARARFEQPHVSPVPQGRG